MKNKKVDFQEIVESVKNYNPNTNYSILLIGYLQLLEKQKMAQVADGVKNG